MGNEDKIPLEQGQAIPKLKSLEEKLELIRKMRGCCAGGPSMCDELLEDRRRERERELAKDGY
jgi:hypothetical protein